MKFYDKNLIEILLPTDGTLSLRSEYYILRDNGKLESLHHSVVAMMEAIAGGLKYSHKMSKGFLFAELIQSETPVSHDVIDFAYRYGMRKKYIKKDVAKYMGLIRNPMVLLWFLLEGFKCGHYCGHGNSTMETMLFPIEYAREDADRKQAEAMADLLIMYNATDQTWLNKQDPTQNAIRAYCDTRQHLKGQRPF